jgi:hypothetical protein
LLSQLLVHACSPNRFVVASYVAATRIYRKTHLVL